MPPGRKRKTSVRRDPSGRSRGHDGIHPETMARRERELREAGIVLEFTKQEAGRLTIKRTATDALSGTTIGKLLLRWRQSPGRPDGISQEQYDTALEWQGVCHRHASIHGYRIDIRSPSTEIGGGLSTAADPDERYVARIKERFRECHNALGREGSPVWSITSAVVLQDHPIDRLSIEDVGNIRVGLNAVGKALKRT